MFDWDAAYHGKNNMACIVSLLERDPFSICLALRIQSQLLTIRLKVHGPAYALPAAIGLHEFKLLNCGLEGARLFEKHMMSKKNRTPEGHLVTNGVVTPGYDSYDSLVVDLLPSLQSSRTTVPKKGKIGLHNFIKDTPGLLGILQELLHNFGVALHEWKQYVSAFHGLVADASMQTAFAWHTDTDDVKGLRDDVITVVVQCTQDVTAMRILGCKPFYFTAAGHVAVFWGRCAHQSIPWKTPVDPKRRVCKAVFFLHPAAGINDLPVPKVLAQVHHSSLNSDSDSDRIACLQFVLERRDLEFEECNTNLPAIAANETPDSTSLTCIEESALSSLWHALRCFGPFGSYGMPQFYIRWAAGKVTGVVWYSEMERRCLAHLCCIAAFKGQGLPLHNAFCAFLQSRDIQRVEAPMALCRIKRGSWLNSLGWKVAKAHGVMTMHGQEDIPMRLHDGDLMYLDLNKRV